MRRAGRPLIRACYARLAANQPASSIFGEGLAVTDTTTVGSCPKCDAEIPLSASACPDCKTTFGPGSMWKIRPLHAPSRASSTASKTVPGGNCWRQGKVLGLRRDSELPHRCLKCNEPAQEPVAVRSMTWHHPGWLLLIPIGILVYVIVAMIVRTRAKVPVPLCAKHKRRRLISLSIGLVGSIVGVIALFGGGAVTAMGLLLLLTGIGFAVSGTRDIYPGRITSGEAYLRGCGPAFLNTIPEGPPSGVEAVSVGRAADVIIVAFIGLFVIGILAAIAIPAYQDYVARARVGEAIASAAPWRQAVEAHYSETKRFPRDTSELRGARPPADGWVGLAGGTLTLTMTQGDAIAGKTVILRPVLVNGALQWDCAGGTVGQRYRPSSCRSANAAAGQPQWSVHAHPEDGFQAEFSGDVTIAPEKLDAQTMERIVRATEYVQDNGSSAYFVVAVLTKNGPTLKNAGTGIARLGCKTILRDSEVPFPAGEGRLIQATDCNNNLRAEARYFASGMWYYQVLALVPKNGDMASAQRFVESFKVAK
jgi:type II secretory pathway pseudopilin PulG